MTLLDVLPSLRGVGRPRLDPALWPSTTEVDEDGLVRVGGVPLAAVADRHGTPCAVLDADDVRGRCRTYRAALPGVATTYAGGALLTRALARWVVAEGVDLAVGSPADLATALAAGVDPARLVVHATAATPDELAAAVSARAGLVVLDTPAALAWAGAQLDHPQGVLLRVAPPRTPGADPVAAGAGTGFTPAEAMAAVARCRAHPHLVVRGLHQHGGGRTADVARPRAVLRRLLAIAADVHDRTGLAVPELHLGGGHAVPTATDPAALDLTALAETLGATRNDVCAARGLPAPRVVVEPGRGVVERAGVSLVRVVAVRDEPAGRTVTVDGAAGPDVRTGLPARHAVALVGRRPTGPTTPTTVRGRARGAADVLAEDVDLPADLHPGDLLAVAGTGAALHAAGCTLTGRPPLVAVADGAATVLRRGEDTAAVLAHDAG